MTHPLPFMGSELLVGEKVRLTRIEQSDFVQISETMNDLGFQRMLRRAMVSPFSTPENMAGWINSIYNDHRAEELPFAVRTLHDDRLLGMLMIKDVFWQSRHCSFFIGIGQSGDRGKGYGTDAIRVMLRYAFCEMNMNCVRLEVMEYNPGGVKSYERAGFKQDGRLRAFVYRDGVYYDIITMSILRDEWVALNPGYLRDSSSK